SIYRTIVQFMLPSQPGTISTRHHPNSAPSQLSTIPIFIPSSSKQSSTSRYLSSRPPPLTNLLLYFPRPILPLTRRHHTSDFSSCRYLTSCPPQ
ncbi:unnamed protein product, partial [Penicillium egyptiacum]